MIILLRFHGCRLPIEYQSTTLQLALTLCLLPGCSLSLKCKHCFADVSAGAGYPTIVPRIWGWVPHHCSRICSVQVLQRSVMASSVTVRTTVISGCKGESMEHSYGFILIYESDNSRLGHLGFCFVGYLEPPF